MRVKRTKRTFQRIVRSIRESRTSATSRSIQERGRYDDEGSRTEEKKVGHRGRTKRKVNCQQFLCCLVVGVRTYSLGTEIPGHVMYPVYPCALLGSPLSLSLCLSSLSPFAACPFLSDLPGRDSGASGDCTRHRCPSALCPLHGDVANVRRHCNL